MVNLKEHMKKTREMYETTGKGERLGFCPNCTNDDFGSMMHFHVDPVTKIWRRVDLVSMMWFHTEYDSGEEFLGRVCPNCGYESWYHTDVIGGLVDIQLEAELRKSRGPKPKLVKLGIWHGAVLGIPSLEQTFESSLACAGD